MKRLAKMLVVLPIVGAYVTVRTAVDVLRELTRELWRTP